MNNEDLMQKNTELEWDTFVYSHPRGNIFQTMALYRVYQDTKNYFPIKVAVLNAKQDEIRGVMTGVIIREIDGFLGDFSAHSIIQGGPLVSFPADEHVIAELIEKYDAIACNASLYTEIRNMYDTQGLFNHIGQYIKIDHLNFLINLNQSEDDVWNQIHKSRRKNVNRAEKAGIYVEEIVNREQILIFYRLLEETYKNVKVPLADISLFESAFRHLVPKGLAKFFLARHKDDYIGARAVLLYKDSIYDWYAGAAADALSYYPNDFLVWYILKWGIKNNYSIFDFGGAGNPNKPYGPREFKRRFGGELVNYGWHTRQYSKTKIKVAELGFKVYQKLYR
jgi:lipid II:glycine glycyltransferase (peptidoglycan interpeptide bridge formation enzyme)